MVQQHSNVIDRIDELTGPDAATWTATPQATSQWDASDPNTMKAILLRHDGPEIVEIRRDQPFEDIAGLVGDPIPERVQYLPDVLFWVGDNSQQTSGFNQGASDVLGLLIDDAASGDYATSDRGRDHAQKLIDDPSFAPVIHGPALITGVVDGSEPGPLSEALTHWFGNLVDQMVHNALETLVAAINEAGLHVVHIANIEDIEDQPGPSGSH